MTSSHPLWHEKTLSELSPLMQAVQGAAAKWKPREEMEETDNSPNYHDRFGIRFDATTEG